MTSFDQSRQVSFAFKTLDLQQWSDDESKPFKPTKTVDNILYSLFFFNFTKGETCLITRDEDELDTILHLRGTVKETDVNTGSQNDCASRQMRTEDMMDRFCTGTRLF